MKKKLKVSVCRGNVLANALIVYVFQAHCGLRFTIIHHNYNPFHENCDAAFILNKMLLHFFLNVAILLSTVKYVDLSPD